MNSKPYEFSRISKTYLLIALLIYELFALFYGQIIQNIFNLKGLFYSFLINPSFITMQLLPIVIFIILFFVLRDRNKARIDNLFNAAQLFVTGICMFYISTVALGLILSRTLNSYTISVLEDGTGLLLPSLITLIFYGFLIYLLKTKGFDSFNSASQKTLLSIVIIFIIFSILNYLGHLSSAYVGVSIIFVIFAAAYILLGNKIIRSHKFLISILSVFVFITLQSIIRSCSITAQTAMWQRTDASAEVLNSIPDIFTVLSIAIPIVWCIMFIYAIRKSSVPVTVSQTESIS